MVYLTTKEVFEDGARYVRSYLADGVTKHGPEEMYYDDELIVKRNFDRGLQDGLEEMYHNNSVVLCRRYYKSGQKHGTEDWFQDDGKRCIHRLLNNGTVVEEEWY